MKIYVSKEVSKKNANFEYLQMFADCDGQKVVITMDRNIIVSILDVAPSKLNSMFKVVGQPVYVGDFVFKKEGNH